jgi:shikimate dehydrogenase
MNPDRYFVLGNPVAHSHSPLIHAMFATQTGQHLHYERRLCPLDGFAQAVTALASEREEGPVRGCNVTVPFKHQALHIAASASERARLAGAANVLSFDDGHWRADNTDGAGLMRDLQVHAACQVQGRRVLLVGAGGAAAGVLGPLIGNRPVQVVVANRTAARAQALVQQHMPLAQALCTTLQATELDRPGQAFDIVLNASASSLSSRAGSSLA